MPGTLVDTSVWVAAFFEEHEFFTSATSFITSRTAGEPALFCRATEQSWLRLITTPSLHKLYKSQNPTNDEATAILANWNAKPHIRGLDAEPEGTRELWLELAAIPRMTDDELERREALEKRVFYTLGHEVRRRL